MPWPTCSLGPLDFLGQISLAEIALTQVARQLPSSGWLSFFAYADSTRVFHFTDEQELVWQDTPQEVQDRSGDMTTCRLILTESWDFPASDDKNVSPSDQDLLKPGEDWIQLGDLMGVEHEYSCHLLGYSRHYRTWDPSPSPESRNLLCLSSVLSLGWNWCDGEHLVIFIPSEDLENQRFEKVSHFAS